MQDTPEVACHSAKEQFDRQAKYYDAQWNAWSQESIEWMLAQGAVGPNDRVLDVATGTGFTALAFAPLAGSVVGLDVSSGMLEEARKRASDRGATNVVFEEGAAEAIPYPDASFDVVTCRIAPHHFVDIHKFAAEVSRVLKPGGRFLLVDTTVPDDDAAVAYWQNEIELLRDPSHIQNYTPGKWRELMEGAGLWVEYCSAKGHGFDIPVSDWLKRGGATAEREALVRECLSRAPEGARTAFNLHQDENGETFVSWQRVTLNALK